jgi:hypothetical protein
VRTDAVESDIVLSKDKLLPNDKSAVDKSRQQSIGVVELDAASTLIHIVDSHGDSKEFLAFMHGFLHVSDVADNRVAKHGVELS